MPSSTEFTTATGQPVYDRGDDSVCVIGAGLSGLAAVKNLKEHGFGVDCYERETSVGGAWNWRNDRSAMFASTHLVSSRPTTEFPDFPMPDDWPDYPDHARYLTYLERYADHFGLRPHVWFGTEVVSVRPAGETGRWDVTTQSTGRAGSTRTHRYLAVVVANGHNWAPRLPRIDGLDDYRGKVIHASAYKDPAELRGRRVLVVGGGNSGADIAVEAGAQAAKTWHSTRRGYWFTPKYLLGRPADQLHARVQGLPLRLRQWLHQLLITNTLGHPARFGLPAPDHRPHESHPVLNSQLLHGIGHGDITPVPDVARFHRTEVELTDGSTIDPDLVVLATGYQPRFEFLDPALTGADADGRPHLLLHAFAPRHPTLAVTGLLQPDSGMGPLVHWQTVAFARWLRLRAADPERAARVWQRLQAEAGRPLTAGRVTDSPRHWFEVGYRNYLTALQRLLDSTEVSA
ncbi:cation diffusion facilitator CzcD-associated flavoprotein CzcO [Catenuloplanes nepalensis]|uniref:Cation diffusion facilitator CzcD-associated flavoprotein CzcO n=1 Tax=Catenuloplanes nepalensis TaxID=587533 RepID=A0ABT9MKE0_9ACTN|nr:NAD(P)-binding domain-containing protein [Catenuloplanes nepalensis]MDP9791880.1 cation diffusion facilitator CzcD-associated flavoprotein CzcO [Catenuloplanes nepalensis]